MDTFLFTVASFILALGILITVHEFGHFWVARRVGVKVLRFSIGFGKPLWKRIGRSDGTEYVVAAIPLGGYVKMLDEREGEVPESEVARAFNRQPLRARAAIVVAGPLFNFLFAILAYWMLFVTGDTGSRAWVGKVAEGSIAYQSGFLAGDELTAISGHETPSWETAIYTLMRESLDGDDLSVRVIDADGNPQTRILPGERLARLGDRKNVLTYLGITPKRPRIAPVIGEVVSGEAADVAGLRSGDLVLSANNHRVELWSDLVTFIKEHPGEQVEFEVSRDGSTLWITVPVGVREEDGHKLGRIGAGVQIPERLYDEYRVEIRLGPLDALSAATQKTWDMSLFMLRMLGRMLTGQASVENLSGPISIAQTAGQSASYGAVYFLKFLALVSISLGVLNLLPVPILDGGHLFFFLIEAVKGSPPSDEFMIQGQRLGMMLLLALMGLAFYVDISRLLG
ncbi:MAG: RIP metalloprotease RseP [Gammaproteobacteria bacterium]|nr:RIP metalloprotease RseP [Gammaproteobacteria bacterium]